MDSGYRFQASGDACGVCQSLDGTDCPTLPHDNCQCQIAPPYECETKVENLTGTPTGPNRATLSAEVTVTCADGSETGMSVEIEVTFDPEEIGPGDELSNAIDAVADELCAQCPDDPGDGVA